MGGSREIASWLISNRLEIERAMEHRLGPAAPAAGSGESEALRRVRSFAGSALLRGVQAAPALDGVRVNDRRFVALLGAWVDAACELAGSRSTRIREALDPLVDHFRTELRRTSAGRRVKGAPNTQRRVVMAAIDRVADAFLAIDTDSGQIADANPAAGALLGVKRDALLGVEAMSFIPQSAREAWWTQIDAMTEGAEPRRFHSTMMDASGTPVNVEASVTRCSARGRTLALILARPRGVLSGETP